MDEIHLIDRKEARALGLRYYYTGNKCKRGHVSPRLVSGGNCVACSRERVLSDEQKERKRAGRNFWLSQKPEKRRAYYEAFKMNNGAKLKDYRRRQSLKRTVAYRAIRELGLNIEGI